MDAIADKSAMRRNFRQKRDAYVISQSPQDKALSFSAVPSPLKSLFRPHKTVAGYIPIGSEANPLSLLSIARAAGCNIALPHVISKLAPMRFLEWRDSEGLHPGPFGLQQPNDTNVVMTPDIVLVPLLAFDRQLNRLGQGAGHYDRALSILGEVIAIGVAWSVQETDTVPADPWDIPLDAILTEKEWICK
jgi:5-formyltetrahydrofolate cyclo-ligase